jgi:hypothetical protein
MTLYILPTQLPPPSSVGARQRKRTNNDLTDPISCLVVQGRKADSHLVHQVYNHAWYHVWPKNHAVGRGMVTCLSIARSNNILWDLCLPVMQHKHTSYAVHPNDQTSEPKLSRSISLFSSSSTSSGAIHRTVPWHILVVFPDGPIRSSITCDNPKSVRTAWQVSVIRTLFLKWPLKM